MKLGAISKTWRTWMGTASLVALTLACGGGGSSDSDGGGGTPPANPVITAFTATPPAVLDGQQASFLATFSNGTGRIMPGNIPISSGQTVMSGALTEPTTFTLTVTNSASAQVTRSLTVRVVGGTFTATGLLSGARYGHRATRRADGTVLVSGGLNTPPAPASAVLVGAGESYDPSTGEFTAAGSLVTARYLHESTLLPSGQVLISGGCDTQLVPTASAECYDTSFTATGGLTQARYAHSATLLLDGKVLVVGGRTNAYVATTTTAEVYDPALGTWSSTGSMSSPRAFHTATRLTDGRVLVVGGDDGGSMTPSAELYDPAAGTWSAAGTMSTGRASHAAVLMADGKVLVAGGSGMFVNYRSAEIWDPVTKTFRRTAGDMAQIRTQLTATPLSGGTVLIGGGSDGSTVVYTGEIYEPVTDTFIELQAMATARRQHTATPLADGRVLFIGGYGAGSTLTQAELYSE